MSVPGSEPLFLAGHRGLVGSAIGRALADAGYRNVITFGHDELDLTRQSDVEAMFARERPRTVVLAAAKVGGIHANSTYPAEFIRDNLAIQTNVIHAAWQHGCQRFVFLGSSCIYPRDAPQPMPEECLLTSPLEATNEAYAIAKIAGLKMCEAYRTQYGFNALSLMPTNLYGPGDNFDPENSHVLPALIRRFDEATIEDAPEVVVWGTGTPRREFLHVDDLAAAVCFVLEREVEHTLINVGTGSDVSIGELATLIADVVGYRGAIRFDTTRPDGTPRKLLNVDRMRTLGWQPRVDLRSGIEHTWRWFRDNRRIVRGSAA